MRQLLRTCSIAMKCIVGYWLFSPMVCFDCFHIKNSHPQIIQEVPTQIIIIIIIMIQEVTLLIDLFTKLTSQNWPNNEHLWQLHFGIKPSTLSRGYISYQKKSKDKYPFFIRYQEHILKHELIFDFHKHIENNCFDYQKKINKEQLFWNWANPTS